MLPLTIRVLVTNAGNGAETVLLVYVLTEVVAVGTAVYALWMVWQCKEELH